MAGIDKTYVTSYEEYKEIIDWAKDTVYVCPNGIEFHVIDFCYQDSEEDIKEWLKESKTIPVMNTPLALDYFLIKDCPIKTIQNRMREVYSKEYIESILTGTSEFDTFVRPTGGKHVRILKKPSSRNCGKWYSQWQKRWKKDYFLVYPIKIIPNEDYAALEYNEDYDKVLLKGELGYITTGGYILRTRCRSFKSLVRKLIKWNLPIGTVISIDKGGKLLITK